MERRKRRIVRVQEVASTHCSISLPVIAEALSPCVRTTGRWFRGFKTTEESPLKALRECLPVRSKRFHSIGVRISLSPKNKPRLRSLLTKMDRSTSVAPSEVADKSPKQCVSPLCLTKLQPVPKKTGHYLSPWEVQPTSHRCGL